MIGYKCICGDDKDKCINCMENYIDKLEYQLINLFITEKTLHNNMKSLCNEFENHVNQNIIQNIIGKKLINGNIK